MMAGTHIFFVFVNWYLAHNKTNLEQFLAPDLLATEEQANSGLAFLQSFLEESYQIFTATPTCN